MQSVLLRPREDLSVIGGLNDLQFWMFVLTLLVSSFLAALRPLSSCRSKGWGEWCTRREAGREAGRRTTNQVSDISNTLRAARPDNVRYLGDLLHDLVIQLMVSVLPRTLIS